MSINMPFQSQSLFGYDAVMKELERRHIHRGRRVDIHELVIENQGAQVKRDLILHPGAVVILPLLDTGEKYPHIVMIENQRYATGETMLEIPAGTLSFDPETFLPTEAPKDCAFRELKEETGYEAAKISEFMTFFSAPGFCNEKLHSFVAEELTLGKMNLDPGESIKPVPIPYHRALDMIQNNQVRDAKTIAVIASYALQNDIR